MAGLETVKGKAMPDHSHLNKNSTAADFIKFFEKIPEEQWTIKTYHSIDRSKHCALGHCGVRVGAGPTDTFNSRPEYPAAAALSALFRRFIIRHGVATINDGDSGTRSDYPQLTPKLRILAALADIQKAGG